MGTGIPVGDEDGELLLKTLGPWLAAIGDIDKRTCTYMFCMHAENRCSLEE